MSYEIFPSTSWAEKYLVFFCWYPENGDQPQWDECPVTVNAQSHDRAAQQALDLQRDKEREGQEDWLAHSKKGEYRIQVVKASNFSEWNIERTYKAVGRLHGQK